MTPKKQVIEKTEGDMGSKSLMAAPLWAAGCRIEFDGLM